HGANGAFENLSIYVPVIREFGWESLRNTFAEYRKKRKYRLDTDDHKKETFVRLWSKHCKANLGPYFEKVGYPYTPSMKASLNQYKAWMPKLPTLEAGSSAPSSLFGSKNESAAARDGADKGNDESPLDEDPSEISEE
ncbi:MAG: M60 family metallopeptidase, partial [Puniceicoccales bacterium]|nr:M60 family metallopeptidase [Puniceicoccales bacterium]